MPDFKILLAKAATEFVGTFFLCLTISLTGASSVAPIAIGFVLMVNVYAGGHVSGAHYNPAVTVALIVRGAHAVELFDAAVYVCVQCGGAICAALISWELLGGREFAAYPAVGKDVSVWSALLAEIMLTFALASVVLHTATSKAQANNSYYGLAIGSTVLSGAISVGRISGGCFNPAVGILPFLYEDLQGSVWIYFAGPLIGGALAGMSFRVVCAHEYDEPPGGTSMLSPLAPYFIEGKGIMLLVFTIGCAAGAGQTSKLVPLSIGCILMVMIYMGGATSGAHYNPAVTLAVLGRSMLQPTHDSFAFQTAVKYFFSQVLGATFGTWFASATMGGADNVGYPALPKGNGVGAGFCAEVVATLLLTYVILNVATSSQLAGNSFFGLAIGQTVTGMAIAMGPISGGAFNPGVGLMGPILSFDGDGSKATNAWIYWLGPLLGGMLSAIWFRFQNFEEFAGGQVMPKFMAHLEHGDHHIQFMAHAHHSDEDPDASPDPLAGDAGLEPAPPAEPIAEPKPAAVES